ncbi:hypothetical protein QEH56_23715 [Pelagicoccus enzymogenes]|uniref:hypothetical protein n=1 Tax=Pelagicoccus enzymogenes TaxID=2773457 RepID=UPI0028102EDC|nr:hypothetical protein [Pelagicoccus enzymogenes]MDQ8201194.1 hypothetical protein [Pelagicoccus enzymogenes]
MKKHYFYYLALAAVIAVVVVYFFMTGPSSGGTEVVSEFERVPGQQPSVEALEVEPVSGLGSKNVRESEPAPTDTVKETRRMVAAHSSLRSPEVADPDSESNRRIMQQMTLQAFENAKTDPRKSR